MPRKSKVEESPHFEEIVDLLLQGLSGRKISTYLKNEYDEDIGFNAINSYRRKHIRMEERVEAELNRRAEERKSEEENDKKLTDHAVEKQVTQKENTENNISSVADTIADNMQGVAKVASELPDMFSKTKADAANPDVPNVTFKDAANLTIQANKIFAEYFKDNEPDVTVNVDNHVLTLEESLERTRQKYQEAKNRG